MHRRIVAALCAVVASGALLAGCDAPPPASCAPDCVDLTAEQTVPTAVEVPKIAARSTLIPLGTTPDNSVEVPSVKTPMQAGWYSKLKNTSDSVAPAVLLGHVNGNGRPGVFARLAELRVGDVVVVSYGDLRRTFRVTRVIEVPKSQFPTRDVYSNTADPELRLVTCGGPLDATGHNYLHQIIAFARAT